MFNLLVKQRQGTLKSPERVMLVRTISTPALNTLIQHPVLHQRSLGDVMILRPVAVVGIGKLILRHEQRKCHFGFTG